MNMKNILKKGFVEMQVKAQGILQKHKFVLEYEKTPFGNVPYLISEYDLGEMELVRIANECQLPVKCGQFKVFPKGKMPLDFTNFK